MNYTILYTKTTDGKKIIELGKDGNRYYIAVWNKEEHRTERDYKTTDFEEAKAIFHAWYDFYKCGKIEEARPDFDATDFD